MSEKFDHQARSSFWSSFQKQRDIIPAVTFAQDFSKRFEQAAVTKFGDIVPNDRQMLYDLATVVLDGMKPANP